MANRYDQRTTTFSQQGRLYQVEYAIEATKSAGWGIGILGKDCVVFAGEKKTTSKLLDQAKMSEKLFEIDDHVACAVAGVTSDANTLIQRIRLYAQQYTFKYGEPVPIEQLVVNLCDLKQGYTQFGGLRPFGVSFLFGGYDKHHGFQIFESTPAGAYDGWKAHTIGSMQGPTVQSILKSDWKEGMSTQEVKELIAKSVIKCSDTTTPDPEKMEWCIIQRTNPADPHAVKYSKIADPEIEKLMSAAKKAEEAAAAARGE